MGTRRQWVLAGAAALLALAGLATVGIRHGSAFPAHWDPRVVPVVRFVERERGRHFRHPVTVEFLTPDRFQATLRGSGHATSGGLVELGATVAELRAVGLVSGQVDLRALVAEAAKDDVLGVYQPDTKHVLVRGTQLTPDVRVTLAHELTHALQDQEIDLAGLERSQDHAGLVSRAVVEGDAVVVEQAYAAALPASEADTYRKERAADVANAGPAVVGTGPSAGVPAVLSDQSVFPYLFGPTFVRALRQSGGSAAVDQALHHPPQAEADVVNPDRWLRKAVPVSVPPPRIRAGDVRVSGPAPFGQFTLFEVLSARVGYRQAWNAVAGWQGDRAVVYRRDRSTCVSVATAFANADQANHFVMAAQEWAATLTGATVIRQGLGVEVRSCQGASAPPVPPPIDPPPFRVLALRASIMGLFIDQGSPARIAQCAADQVIDRVGPSQLIAYDSGLASADVARSITDAGRQAKAACRSSTGGAG